MGRSGSKPIEDSVYRVYVWCNIIIGSKSAHKADMLVGKMHEQSSGGHICQVNGNGSRFVTFVIF